MLAYKVTVKGLDKSIPVKQINDYFSFCGKIKDVKLEQDPSNTNLNLATVEFEKPAAIRTALLLSDDSEIGGSKVQIEADPEVIALAEKNAGTESPNHKPNGHNDIDQEHKPRSAIIAEILSQGYVLGDKVISRALDLDKKHGIYKRFAQFLTDLDAKYNIREKSETTDKAYGITDKVSTQSARVVKYFDYAVDKAQERTGLKLREFYAGAVNNALEVHAEARRLAELKKQQQQQQQQGCAEKVETNNKH